MPAAATPLSSYHTRRARCLPPPYYATVALCAMSLPQLPPQRHDALLRLMMPRLCFVDFAAAR